MSALNGPRKTSTPVINWAQLRKKSITNQPRLMKGKFLCIVTGAANGFGRAISSTVFQDNGIFPLAMAGSRLVLIDNDEEGLRETSGKKMRQFLKHRKIEVELVNTDLSNLAEMKTTLDQVFTKLDKDFEQVLFINHASSLADPSKYLADYTDIHEMDRFWELNLTSRVHITTSIDRFFTYSKRIMVVVGNADLSKSTPCLGLNNMASGAIKMFAETFAKENKRVRVIHYTPPRIDSNKTKTLLEQCACEELKSEIAAADEQKTLLPPEVAAKKLIKVLEEEIHRNNGELEIIIGE